MTRLLFRTALTELMQEKPFPQITIKEICEKADLNRTTFYLHYADQADLLEEIENEVQQKTVEYLEHVKPSANAPDMIEAFLVYIRDYAPLFRVLLLGSGAEGFRRRFIEKTLEKVRMNIPAPAHQEMEPYLMSFLMQGCVHMIAVWIERGFDIAPFQLAAYIFELCNRVAPQKEL